MMKRLWRLPLFLSGLFLLSQAFPLPSPVRDAATLQWVPGFSMRYPLWHVVFTPFCGIADLLTVLSYHEGMVTLAWVIGLLFAFSGIRRGLILTVILISYIAWGALIPRPMGKLMAQDPAVLLIDFHSHTQVSHDGRPSFTAEANRRWHWNQGYNAAFITDHNRTEAAVVAKENSRRDWQTSGYRSLEGEEVSLYKTHLVLLGNHERIDNKPYDSDPGRIRIFLSDMSKRGLPVVASLPEYWWYHWGNDVQNFVRWGIQGFEIINSAPKALDFPLQKRMEIVHLCQRENLFMTGISDNHGYGYATAVWNAMRVPGWQTMDPDRLESAVLAILKSDRFNAVQVLERARFIPAVSWELAFAPPVSAWLYWRSLQPEQAISWVVWIWTLWILYPTRGKRPQRSGPKT